MTHKEILTEAMKRWADQPMTDRAADHLATYFGAYKALCHLHKTGDGDEMDDLAEIAEAVERRDFTKLTANAWMSGIKNEDGSTGPYWTEAQTTSVMNQRGMIHKSCVFWAVMNSLRSDYIEVAKKYGVDSADFWADMAEAWLNDADAVADKVGEYYEHIVKHSKP